VRKKNIYTWDLKMGEKDKRGGGGKMGDKDGMAEGKAGEGKT